MRYTVDCEFDGHGGPLISIALVPEVGEAFYLVTDYREPADPWVRKNVMPQLLDVPWQVQYHQTQEWVAGMYVREYLLDDPDDHAVIYADSPVDIGRLCNIISTGNDGMWRSFNAKAITFEVRNVDCWPNNLGSNAVQHNAYWDAVALWEKINA